MGACNSTLNEEKFKTILQEELAPIKRELAPIKKTLIFIVEDTIAPTARLMATKHTISIHSDGHRVGHGLLTFAGNDHFIVTAAHVAAVLGNKSLSIEWKPWDGAENKEDVSLNKIYLSAKYLSQGHVDVAVVQISFREHSTLVNRLQSQQVGIAGIVLGKTLVGMGSTNFHIHGKNIFSVDDRKLVNAPSMPGMSGCPLFEANEATTLAGFVHGSSKHSASEGGTSPYLNADFSDEDLQEVNLDFYGAISCAEELPEDFDNFLIDTYANLSDEHQEFMTALGRAMGLADIKIKASSMHALTEHLSTHCLRRNSVRLPGAGGFLVLRSPVSDDAASSEVPQHGLSFSSGSRAATVSP